MFKAVFGNNNYVINLEGVIKRASGEECTLPQANGKIEISLFRSKRWVDVKWLSLMSHYEVALTGSHFRWAWDITFVDFIPQIVKSNCCSKMILPRPFLINGTHRIVPGFTHLAVSCSGELLVKQELSNSWEKITIQVNGDEYPYVEVYDPDFSIVRKQMIHRLVALAWVSNPSPEYLHLVNHKNSVRTDYRKDNLEWVDAAGNSEHAIKYGFRTDAIKCKVYDVETTDVLQFDSIGAACRYMGTTNRNVLDLAGLKQTRLINNRYQFRILDDDREWITKEDLIRGNGRYVVTITSPDGSKEIYRDTRLVIRDYKLWNISYGINSIYLAFSEKYPNHEMTWIDQHLVGPFQALRIKDNRVFEAETMADLGKLVGETRSTIRRKVYNKDQKPLNGFSYRVKTKDVWEHHKTPFIESSWCIKAIHPINGELTFKSLREAAKHFKVDRSLISARLKNGNAYKNWEFSKVELNH